MNGSRTPHSRHELHIRATNGSRTLYTNESRTLHSYAISTSSSSYRTACIVYESITNSIFVQQMGHELHTRMSHVLRIHMRLAPAHHRIARPVSYMSLSRTPTDGGDRTLNNYDCQNFQQVFTELPTHMKHVFSGVLKISSRISRE